jgi:hypothetical protein
MMKSVVTCLFSSLLCIAAASQTEFQAENIFVITTDGFRWQEIFTGADSSLLNDPRYVQDTGLARQLYWDGDVQIRRKMLMPFFWEVIARDGQLYGNRKYENKVNVKNLYKISYPGYNEIFTGTTDPRIVINLPRNNHHPNVLEWLNRRKEYEGKVAAFSSWNLFPYIFDADRSDFLLNSGYASPVLPGEDSAFGFIQAVQDHMVHKSHTRYDWLTFLNAREYIAVYHPKVVFIGLGETDEFAHQGKYDLYLQQAGSFDRMVGELWYFVQTHAFYRNKTVFLITTDHGRGEKPGTWHTHNFLTRGSGQTWLALLGPGIAPLGERMVPEQLFEKQFAATIAGLLGVGFWSWGSNSRPVLLPEYPEIPRMVPDPQVVSK